MISRTVIPRKIPRPLVKTSRPYTSHLSPLTSHLSLLTSQLFEQDFYETRYGVVTESGLGNPEIAGG